MKYWSGFRDFLRMIDVQLDKAAHCDVDQC
jgi:hypothetical protein